MKLYILTEINIVDYSQSQVTPQVFLNAKEAEEALKNRAEELYDDMKDNVDWDFEKGKRSYCQYEDGYACRNSDTLEIFEVEL
jgi:hypothetical protein